MRLDSGMRVACVKAALADMVDAVKASPYARAYAGYGGSPRVRLPRLPRNAGGMPRPAADPFGAYGVRRVTRLPRLPGVPKIPGVPRVRGY